MKKGGESEQGFNRQLASQVRPGWTLEQLKAVWGSRWEAPHRKTDGYIGLGDKTGFSVRVDRQGRTGWVSFGDNFPVKYLVEHLQLGMSKEIALDARPHLKPCTGDAEQESSDLKYGLERHSEALTDGCMLSVVFKKDSLIGISIELPGCDYPSRDDFVAAPPGLYPPPAGARGAPFSDPNLKLYVLDALRQSKHVDLGDACDLAMHVRGAVVDFDQEGYELIDDVYEYLARYPLSAELLAKVDCLHLDQTCEIVHYAFPHFDGESDEFEVRSLVGIENCPNLRELGIAFVSAVDLAPLRSVSALESICVEETGRINGTAIFLELPNLKDVRLSGSNDLDGKTRSALAARGVDVDAD